jgi:hypothetical protein
MSKLTAMLTMIALGSAAPAAMASSNHTYDRRAATQRVVVTQTRDLRAPGRFDGRERFDRTARLQRPEPAYHAWDRRSVDDFGPRRYRPTWVALGAPVQLGRIGQDCIEVGDGGTFTQLRLQTAGGVARIDRVLVQFADGSDQLVSARRVLDDRDDLLEIPLDGNNRRIDRVTVFGTTGAGGALEVFAI